MNKKKSEFRVTSIQYVYNPEGDSQWFESYVEFFKESMIKRAQEQLKSKEE